MDEANRQARIGAGLELLACVLNGLIATMWFLSLALFLVGFLWLVPLGLVAVEACLALFVLVAGQNKLGWVGPAIGLFVSLCNLNLVAAGVLAASLRFQLSANRAAAEAAEFDDDRLAA